MINLDEITELVFLIARDRLGFRERMTENQEIGTLTHNASAYMWQIIAEIINPCNAAGFDDMALVYINYLMKDGNWKCFPDIWISPIQPCLSPDSVQFKEKTTKLQSSTSLDLYACKIWWQRFMKQCSLTRCVN